MSLSIGVVNIKYLDYPGERMYAFMRDLTENPEVGLESIVDPENAFWDGYGGFGNAFYEFEKGGLINRANGWASQRKLSYVDRVALIRDIEKLPFRKAYGTETIMLHLSV